MVLVTTGLVACTSWVTNGWCKIDVKWVVWAVDRLVVGRREKAVGFSLPHLKWTKPGVDLRGFFDWVFK